MSLEFSMNVSDFRLASACIRKFCKFHAVPFLDLDVLCEESKGTHNINVSECKSLKETLYSIVEQYLNKFEKLSEKPISQEMKDQFLAHHKATVEHATKGYYTFEEAMPKGGFAQRLYQRPFLWLLMKDIVCPVFGVNIKNILLVNDSNPYIDVQYCSSADSGKEDFIYVNYDLASDPIADAHVLCEAMIAHGLDCRISLQQILESNLWDKIFGLAKMAYGNETDAQEFFAVLLHIVGLDESEFPHISTFSEDGVKTAQHSSNHLQNPMMWWYFGLTEKMLDSVRGPDWSTTDALQGYVNGFFDEVDRIKEKRKQGDGVTFNELLRLKHKQTDGNHNDVRHTIEDLLSGKRVL